MGKSLGLGKGKGLGGGHGSTGKHGSSTEFTAADDAALVEAALQGVVAPAVAAVAVPLSAPFTPHDIAARWKYLLNYATPEGGTGKGSPLAELASARKALRSADVVWSAEEDKVLAGYSGPRTAEALQALLGSHAAVFHPTRTPKDLLEQLMVLDHVAAVTAAAPQSASSFAALEEELFADADRTLCKVMKDKLRWSERAHLVPLLEGALAAGGGAEARAGNGVPSAAAAQALLANEASSFELATALRDAEWVRNTVAHADRVMELEPLVELRRHMQWSPSTLALLRGSKLFFAMAYAGFTFGRGSGPADVDLAVEGACPKVSRLQGAIKLKADGFFYLVNLGSARVAVNGARLRKHGSMRLPHNACLQIANLTFIFEVNQVVMPQVRAALAPALDAAKAAASAAAGLRTRT
ncbi:uncharacterized protein AMSG_03186 [Thecamonas trahens ATCC 50062]|uniref:FHA domain-containing protein n=1 Tax=Thecamonas trahens ATCC 50062 TaxID=461836 RepID=A0A0L0D334_THETB|nr:hypothetical protein AMSG_03186 [Thecamonas trahens ATCC 50062]KNC46757.1 hypothetical protein AMSG_03186 [Thecamonas trahens ATCC 50062]|eukprot:XP_013760037.1 hypothetical protein AMSG_03186 [Thecamonas trahens ATCC 50062]